MTRLFRTLFAALSLCWLLVSAQPAAACGSEQDLARFEVRDFLYRLGLKDRLERVDVSLDEGMTHGEATVRLKRVADPLVLGLEHTDHGWVVLSHSRSES